VLVKGPPGTGKSHTIANLICHLLASGQRVLVTAYAPKALAVLRGLLPEDIRDLCVTSLGSSRDDQRFLEESVGGILRRKNEWRGPLWDDQAVSQTEAELRHWQDALAGLERQLRECREAETYPHTLSGGYQGTAARIARRVEEERERFSWFPQLDRDDVPFPVELREVPFLAEVHTELTEATREELRLDLGGLLPTPEEFTKLVGGLAAAEESADRLVSGAEPEKLNALHGQAVERCLDTLVALEEQAVRAERVLGSMAEDVLGDLLVGSKERWQRLACDAASLVDAAATLSEKVGTARIQLAADVDQDRLRTDVRRRRDHFAEGGRRGVWVLAPRVVRETRYVEESCLVDGQQPRQAQLLDRLADFLGLSFAVQEFARLWPTGLAESGGPKAAVSVAADLLKELQNLLEFFGKSDPQGLGVPLGQRADLAVPEVRTAWLKAAEAASACRRVTVAKKRLEECVEAIRRCQDSGHHHSCLERLAEAVRGRDSQAWGQAWRTRELLRRQQERLRNYEELVEELTNACPALGEILTGTAGDPEWKGRILELDKAWAWASACAWLRRVSGQGSYHELVRDFHRVQKEVEKKTEELVALLAWREFFARLDEGTRQNLVAWTATMGRGGKFTGKYSYRRRREARGYLMGCVPKMPAWVMPLHKLWDTVGHEPGLFDTVIVDEASQAGVESLALLLLARRIIVVGDDKQNSPETVGILEDDIAGLIRQHLGGFRFRDQFHPQMSLFDHGVRAFGNQVSLREHFRCVPEIIRFSNDNWYRDAPLIPLRQAPPGRLAPLKERYIPEGSCEGERSGIRNRAEAEAVVATIQSLVKDKDYEGKTMGVIALQGRAQAELIERLLGERLEPSVIEDRKLRCGEPATFQGDERDVMFLSMVIAPNVHYRALTEPTAQRRFNVAMSRARDQVWLFHSVKQNDLSTECFRRHLLRFFESLGSTEGGPSESLEHLERDARRPRRLGTQPEPYESWFEVDVALELLRRRYMVRPQVDVAGKRIDLVVEGIDARLAVECDGDEWHGPEQFEQDMSRQRQLERAGWTFVRVRESDFYANRADAVAAVIDACEELGVRPRDIGEEAHVSSAAPDSDSQGGPVPEEVEEVTEELPVEREPAEGGLLQVVPAGSSVACGFPDPRDASPRNVRAALQRIIETDGPVTRDSVYRLYVDGCAGLQRAGKVVRQALNQALAAMLRSGEVIQEDELRVSPVR
jgi:very-short-patch-repair endonuclease